MSNLPYNKTNECVDKCGNDSYLDAYICKESCGDDKYWFIFDTNDKRCTIENSCDEAKKSDETKLEYINGK